MNEQKKYIICLMGPTASGKSDLALQIAEKMGVEIVSVDSAMIYKHMDIGTAKPSAIILKKYPHHLIDILDANQSYSVAKFLRDAQHATESIINSQHFPFMVGGTMMYFNAIQHGISALPSANYSVRNKFIQHANNMGWESLYQQLMEIDPISANRIHPNDPQRILRALEVYELTGKSLSTFSERHYHPFKNYKCIMIAIAPQQREILHQRIAQRFYNMLSHGFIEEVKAFYHRKDMDADLPSMRCVGYRQVWQYLAGSLTYEEMQEKAIIATRQLAKRQLTWLRSWPNIQWFDSETPQLLSEIYSYIAKRLGEK